MTDSKNENIILQKQRTTFHESHSEGQRSSKRCCLQINTSVSVNFIYFYMGDELNDDVMFTLWIISLLTLGKHQINVQDKDEITFPKLFSLAFSRKKPSQTHFLY